MRSNCGATTSAWAALPTFTTRPVNDNCSGAVSLTINSNTTCTATTNGTTVAASQSQSGCSGTADDDVWYTFTATATSHTVTVTPGTLSNAVLEVFSGTCGGTLTSLGCQNSTTGTSAEVLTVSGLSAGTTYFVRVYSNANGSGQGTFTVCVTTPYDPCASITNISSCGTTISASIPAGTGAYSNSSCGFTTSGIEKIYTFTPAYTGAYNILNVSSYTYIDYQYKPVSGGCGSSGWNCIDDISAANTTSPAFNLTGGTQYYLLLDPESIVAGSVDFKIVCAPTCMPPSGLTTGTVYTNSTSIRWNTPSAGNVPASYDLYYSTSSTAPNGSTTPTIAAINDTFQYVNGLASNTTYYVWVRSFCGGTDYSSWVALPTFTTSNVPDVEGIPIVYYDFEDNSTRTTYENVVEQSVNSVSSSALTVASGTGAINRNGAGLSQYASGGYVGVLDGKSFAMYESSFGDTYDPGVNATRYAQFSVNTTGFSGLTLTFDVLANDTWYSPYYGILYSTDGTNWNFVASYDTPGSGNNLPFDDYDWQKAFIKLPADCDDQSNLRIRIYTYDAWDNTTYDHLRFDNLTVFAKTNKPGISFTSLNETAIYTSAVSSPTDLSTVWIRYNYTLTGTNTTMYLGSFTSIDGNVTISNGATLNFYNPSTSTATYLTGGDNFTMGSGCTLGITNSNGITLATATGNVRKAGTRSYSSDGNYNYIYPGNMVTGNGLPASVTNLTINKTNTSDKVTLTNSVQAKNTLYMLKGNVYTGANLLEVGQSTTALGTLNYTRGTSGFVVGNMRRWFNGTNSGDASGLYPLAQEVLGSIKNRFFLLEYTAAPSTGGSLDVYFNNNRMWYYGLPITNIVTPSSAGCPSGSTFDVTTTADQGYWVATPANINGGTYTLAITGQDIVTITELCQLSLLKRVGNGPWTAPGNQIAPTGTISMPTLSRSGLSGFSNFGFGGGSPNPLPIELSAFHVKCRNGSALISWTTLSEENSKEFVVERSINGITFEAIGVIPAAGSSNSLKEYSITDNSISTLVNYYRLKMVDNDGVVKYSAIVELDCENGINGFNVYYTPDQGIIIKSQLSEQAEYNFELIDVAGKKIQSLSKQLDAGISVFNMDLKKVLADGIYMLRINKSSGSVITTKKLLIH